MYWIADLVGRISNGGREEGSHSPSLMRSNTLNASGRDVLPHRIRDSVRKVCRGHTECAREFVYAVFYAQVLSPFPSLSIPHIPTRGRRITQRRLLPQRQIPPPPSLRLRPHKPPRIKRHQECPGESEVVVESVHGDVGQRGRDGPEAFAVARGGEVGGGVDGGGLCDGG